MDEMEGCGFLGVCLLPQPGFPSPSPPPLFPSLGDSGAFFRMGLVQSPGPFAGGSQAGAERLMAALESCQLSLMNVDFCCWPLKSVLLWSRTMQKPNRDPPRLLRDYSFWNLLEMDMMPIWEEACVRKWCWWLWHFDTVSHFTLPPPRAEGLAD